MAIPRSGFGTAEAHLFFPDPDILVATFEIGKLKPRAEIARIAVRQMTEPEITACSPQLRLPLVQVECLSKDVLFTCSGGTPVRQASIIDRDGGVRWSVNATEAQLSHDKSRVLVRTPDHRFEVYLVSSATGDVEPEVSCPLPSEAIAEEHRALVVDWDYDPSTNLLVEFLPFVDSVLITHVTDEQSVQVPIEHEAISRLGRGIRMVSDGIGAPFFVLGTGVRSSEHARVAVYGPLLAGRP